MKRPGGVRRNLAASLRGERRVLFAARLGAVLVSSSSVLLLGLSGWFVAACAFAGAAAPAFNSVLPAAAIRLLALCRTGGRYGERLFGHDGVLRAFARLRPALFADLAAAPPERVLALSTGEAVSRLTDDVDELERDVVTRTTAPWSARAAMATGLAALLGAGGPAAAASMALVVGAMTAVAWGLDRAAARQGGSIPVAGGRLRDALTLLCEQRAELRVYALSDWILARVDRQGADLVAAQRRAAELGAGLAVLQAVCGGIAAVLAFALALRHGADGRVATPRAVEVAVLSALVAGMTVEGAGSRLRGRERRVAAREAERRLDALPAPVAAGATAGSAPRWSAGTSLRWDDGTVLAPGTIAALAGPSGCGKTTLLEQMVGLRPAPAGRLEVGGRDLHDLRPGEARRCFVLAPQEPALLIGTVRENLLLARPDAADEALWEALRDAALDARIRRLPEGLETWLGDAPPLSGGERRRLGLARAYLADVPWLLLDEPTEQLDAATAAAVIARLRPRLRRRRQGALVVTHRPAVLARCDLVLPLGGAAFRSPMEGARSSGTTEAARRDARPRTGDPTGRP